MMIGGAWLALAACLSLAAGMLHLAVLAGGPVWYRVFGAGERLASAAERRETLPMVITCGIALILALWAGYAASGAGLIVRLPLLRPALVAITTVYLARGMVLFWPALLRRPDLSPNFLRWSSAIALLIGAVHLVGLSQAWPLLGVASRV